MMQAGSRGQPRRPLHRPLRSLDQARGARSGTLSPSRNRNFVAGGGHDNCAPAPETPVSDGETRIGVEVRARRHPAALRPPLAAKEDARDVAYLCGRTTGETAGNTLIPPNPKPPMLVPSGEEPLVRRAAAAIDAARHGYDIATLQWLRKELRIGKTRSGSKIFHRDTISDRWAFHYGGRKEIQFNIGLDEFEDGSEAFRVGIGFSLEQSPTLTDWRTLLPRIRRFNDYAAANPDDFVGDQMWHFDPKDQRSPDRPAGPIEDTILAENVFIFLGERFPIDAVDVHACLRIFDRLLPLYRYVQDDTEASEAAPIATLQISATPNADVLRLDACVETRQTGWRKRSIAARTLDVALRHHEIQNRLRAKLLADGFTLVGLEARLGRRAIDVVTRHDGELWFWEVKTAGDVRQCLREAIGQLLEYALWDGNEQPERLIVVGDGPLTPASRTYLERLNTRFPIRLEYRQFRLADD
jgi:hypothetical protein